MSLPTQVHVRHETKPDPPFLIETDNSPPRFIIGRPLAADRLCVNPPDCSGAIMMKTDVEPGPSPAIIL
jgi:hypothetical protein